MAQTTSKLVSSLNRMNVEIDLQRGRMGLMQRWLDEHSERLDSLSDRLDAHLSRLDALLGKASM
jgi:hypothetical protein